MGSSGADNSVCIAAKGTFEGGQALTKYLKRQENERLAYTPTQNISDQSRKLMMVLRFAVGHLDCPQTLGPAVTVLGARHVAYGVKPEQFAPLGAALLHTLEVWLREAFDGRARQVWSSVYGALAGLMEEGMQAAAMAGSPRHASAG